MLKRLNELRVSTQFFIQFVVWIIMLLTVVCVVYSAKVTINYHYTNLISSISYNHELAKQIKEIISNMATVLDEYIQLQDPILREKIELQLNEYDAQISVLRKQVFENQGKESMLEFFETEFNTWQSIKNKVIFLKQIGNSGDAEFLLDNQGTIVYERMNAAIETVLRHDNELFNQTHTYIINGFYRLLFVMTVIFLLIIAVNLVLMIVTYNSIVTPLLRIKKVAKKVKNGDYRSRIEYPKSHNEMYEVAYMINQMLDKISDHQDGLRGTISNLDQLNAQLALKNSEMEDFVKIISHDIRSPLSTIEMFSSILEKEIFKSPEKAFEDIERIKNNIIRLRMLLDDLSEYSLVENVELNKSEIDMLSLIKDVLELMGKKDIYHNKTTAPSCQDIFDEKKHIIVFSITHDEEAEVVVYDIPVVSAVESQIRQVVLNFLSNAVKYRSGEKLVVVIRGWRENDCVHITFKDNGRGMDPKYKDKIFDMCCRLIPRSEIDGTGVGLALVKKIIERHNGNVWVESEGEGCGGSTFHITLPVTS